MVCLTGKSEITRKRYPFFLRLQSPFSMQPEDEPIEPFFSMEKAASRTASGTSGSLAVFSDGREKKKKGSQDRNPGSLESTVVTWA